MPIRCQDIVEANATLELRCRECGRIVIFSGANLLRFGADTVVTDLVQRFRCAQDGMMPDGWIVLDPVPTNGEAQRRKIDIHEPKPWHRQP